MITGKSMDLKEVRTSYGISQVEAAKAIGIPSRTYRRYESDANYGNIFKRNAFIELLNQKYQITEEKGLLTTDQIKSSLSTLFKSKYKDTIDFCYLFGSYAKGYATEKSDVDLCVSTSLTGLDVFGLAEDIRNVLHKKIDLVRYSTLENNFTLTSEIMKDGIKIYG